MAGAVVDTVTLNSYVGAVIQRWIDQQYAHVPHDQRLAHMGLVPVEGDIALFYLSGRLGDDESKLQVAFRRECLTKKDAKIYVHLKRDYAFQMDVEGGAPPINMIVKWDVLKSATRFEPSDNKVIVVYGYHGVYEGKERSLMGSLAFSYLPV